MDNSTVPDDSEVSTSSGSAPDSESGTGAVEDTETGSSLSTESTLDRESDSDVDTVLDSDSVSPWDTGSTGLSTDTVTQPGSDSISDPETTKEDSETGSLSDGDSEVESDTPTEIVTDTVTSGDLGTDTDTPTDTPSTDPDADGGVVDSDTGCSPGLEVCDGVDNDCNLAIDDTPAMTPLCPEDQACIDGVCILLPVEQDCVGYQYSTHAYALCWTAVDWDTAKDRCEKMGAHLATVGSEGEDLAIKTLAPGKQDDAWIGLRRWDPSCDWEWVTLEPVDYTAWPLNYPDGACGAYDCCQIWSKEDAQWDDTYCTDEQPYICEWEPA